MKLLTLIALAGFAGAAEAKSLNCQIPGLQLSVQTESGNQVSAKLNLEEKAIVFKGTYTHNWSKTGVANLSYQLQDQEGNTAKLNIAGTYHWQNCQFRVCKEVYTYSGFFVYGELQAFLPEGSCQ